MTIDIRALDSHEYDRLHKAVLEVCERHQATCTVASDGVPTHYKLSDPFIAPFVRSLEEVTGIKQTGYFAMGASDARHFVPYGTPCIMVYPEGGGIHSAGEWLEVKALEQFKHVTKRYLAEMACNPL